VNTLDKRILVHHHVVFQYGAATSCAARIVYRTFDRQIVPGDSGTSPEGGEDVYELDD